jgi:hypothetical protein
MQEALRPPRWYATMLGVAMIVAGGPSLVSGLDLGIRSLAWLAHLEVPDQEVTRITWLTQVPLAVVLFAEGLLFVGVGVVAFVRRPGLGPLLVCLALPSLWGQIHTGVVSGWDRLVPEVHSSVSRGSRPRRRYRNIGLSSGLMRGWCGPRSRCSA